MCVLVYVPMVVAPCERRDVRFVYTVNDLELPHFLKDIVLGFRFGLKVAVFQGITDVYSGPGSFWFCFV